MIDDSGLDGSSRETLEYLRDQGFSDDDLFYFQLLVLINMLEKIQAYDIVHFDRDEWNLCNCLEFLFSEFKVINLISLNHVK